MLKRWFAVAAILGCVASHALEGRLFFTLAPNVADEFVHIMPYRPPYVPHVGKCVRHQPVTLYLVLAKPAADKDGKVLIEAESIVSTDADGKTKELVEPGKPMVVLRAVKKTPRDFSGIVLSGLFLTMVAEDDDRPGKMRMTVKLRDKGDDSVLKLTAAIELVEQLPGAPEKPMTEKELNDFLTGYYRNPDPAKIPAALTAFMKLDDENFGRKKTYDPLMWLCGFAELYKLNPQLRPALVGTAAEYSGLRKQYIALILAEAGAADAELEGADPELRQMFDKVKGKAPLSFGKITSPAQLDALWVIFFVTGKFEPIRRLVGELAKRDNVMTVEEAQKLGRKPNKDEMKKIMNGLIDRAAGWSLNSNAGQHRLVGYYMESMLMRKKCPDHDAALKVGAILINAGLVKMAKTPEGKLVMKPVIPAGKGRAAGGTYSPSGGNGR